jgi:hypothetical protein
MGARPLGAGSVDRFISSREGVSSTSSWSSGGRSGYFEESMAVGRCLVLTLGFFGTRFRSPFFVGSLCEVCSVCLAMVLLPLSVRST